MRDARSRQYFCLTVVFAFLSVTAAGQVWVGPGGVTRGGVPLPPPEAAAVAADAVTASASPYPTSLAGDKDNFGGYTSSSGSCETFDNRGAADLGIFDQRQPGSSYGSICSFAGAWTHSVVVPPGGVGQFSVRLRILGGESGTTSQCWAAPCGCTPSTERLLINGIPQDGFLPSVGCNTVHLWTRTFRGAEANALAGTGQLALAVEWNNDAFAIDYSEVLNIFPSVDVAVLSGDLQQGSITNSLEKKLVVQFTTADASFDVSNVTALFEVVTVPKASSQYGVGASAATATSATYTAPVGADGRAEAVLMLGDVPGDYIVRVGSPWSLAGSEAVFTETAKKPSAIAVLKDTPDLAERTATYAISATTSTTFHAIALDASAESLGPIDVGWSLSASGNPKTRGEGVFTGSMFGSSVTFEPAKAGKLLLHAKSPLKGVPVEKIELFLTTIYLSVEAFDPGDPQMDLPQYLPGAALDGSSILPQAMPQQVNLAVMTGDSSRGTVVFDLVDVSTYPGIAMNWGSPPVPQDMYFVDPASGAPTSTVTVKFSGTGVTEVALFVNDYAAKGVLWTKVHSGKTDFGLEPLTIPIDVTGNGIADRGWIAGTAPIPDAPLDPGSDEDVNPTMHFVFPPIPAGGAGAVGDNLTNVEEYRGFVVNEEHRRTNPFHRDVFVEIEAFGGDLRFAYPALSTATHRILPSELSSSYEVNPHGAGLPGSGKAWPHGHRGQRAIRFFAGSSSPWDLLGETQQMITNGELTPAVPNTVFPSVVYVDAVHQTAVDMGASPFQETVLRRMVVAHEAGHAVNLYENVEIPCLMFGGSFRQHQSFLTIPSAFCQGLSDTYLLPLLYPATDAIPVARQCFGCPLVGVQVFNFSETDTLRTKEIQ